MNVRCPHCTTEYDAEESEYGRFVKCAVCGKGFVAGTSLIKRSRVIVCGVMDAVKSIDDEVRERTKIIDRVRSRERARVTTGRLVQADRRIQDKKIAWFRQLFVSAPWTIQFSSVYMTVFGMMLTIMALITSTPPSSFVQAIVVFAIVVTVGFTLVRFNIIRWLLVAWGTFNLIVLLFGSKDFACFWPFHASFIAVAILLLTKPSCQWYRHQQTISSNTSVGSCRRTSRIASVLAVIAGVILFVGFNSERVRTTRNKNHSYGGQFSSSSHPSPSIPSETSSATSSYLSPANAKEGMNDALENVRKRYRRNLERFNLVESFFCDREDLCQLVLVEPIGDGTLYHIRYWKSSNWFEWSRFMPKDVAEQFLHDRMLIYAYTKMISK